jgi:hypothetical protein
MFEAMARRTQRTSQVDESTTKGETNDIKGLNVEQHRYITLFFRGMGGGCHKGSRD